LHVSWCEISKTLGAKSPKRKVRSDQTATALVWNLETSATRHEPI
jgi:hypothetical protein